MKKRCASFFMFNLILSIVAFSFILNIGIVSGEESNSTPSATGTPAGFSDHGYAGDAGEFIFGAENVAPKGYEWVDGKWKYTPGAGPSGFGYSVTGIVQGAM